MSRRSDKAEGKAKSPPDLLVRSCVVFDWSEAAAGTPPGLEIAVFMRSTLWDTITDIDCLLAERGQKGWEFEVCPKEGPDFLVAVWQAERWLVVLRPLLRGIFRRSWPPREEIEAVVLRASRVIHAFLAKDSSFSNVRWYTERELAERHENPAAGSPEPGEV